MNQWLQKQAVAANQLSVTLIPDEATDMPFYDYHCLNCDHTFEVLQKIDAPAPAACPSCDQGRLEKLLSAPALQSSGGGGGGGGGHVHGPGCRH